ncbi:MAG: S46 family peptidase [Sphingomonadales bacterium]|nr:S46 family peptidase [Sphingomonadales bacterium]
MSAKHSAPVANAARDGFLKRWVRLSTLLLATTAFAGSAHGDEGMWLIDQTAGYASIAPDSSEKVTLPLGAVTALGSCTASFVSSAGLLLTNHHCLSGSVQYNSAPDRNYWTNGFVARERRDELPAAPGTRIHVIEQWREVTRELDAGTAGLAKKQREKLVESRRKALLAPCESLPGRRCYIRSYWGGTRQYFEQRLELQDIRLVYAPAAGLGDFGGDTDNWNWPRHSGDFGFYRAYVAPDGTPAPYAAGNIPYTPPAVLTVSREGVSEGEPVWTAGFPVSTNRLATAAEATFDLSRYEPAWLALLKDYEAQIVAATAGQAEKQMRYANILDNASNYRKKLIGSLAGAEAANVPARKQAFEAALQRWAKGKAGQDKLAPALGILNAAASEREAMRLYSLQRSTLERAQLLQAARVLYRWAKERGKADADRAAGFRDADRQLVSDRLRRIQSRFDALVDRSLFERALEEYHKLPASERSQAFETHVGAMDLDQVYSATRLGNLDDRLAWLDQPASAFERSTDPFIQLAVTLYPDDEAREEASRALSKRTEAARDTYLAAVAAYRNAAGMPAYPDADGTMRISRGRIERQVRDGEIWTPFTTAVGLLEKQRGDGDFNAPERLVSAIRARDFGAYAVADTGQMPVNFLSSADITNGNSGSPTLNAKGEIVGLVFDGTTDGVISDWFHVAERNRTIHVDIRFILWVMEKVDGAGHIVREMTGPQ